MFEGLTDLAAAWRTIVHVSEWTGLSVGALAAGAALFAYVPLARKLVIAGAVIVVVGWIGTIHGDRVGRADLQAQWDDAKTKAEAAQKKRDADIGRELEATYQPKLAALQSEAAERKARSDALEQKLAAMAKRQPVGGACLLGDLANRVRRAQR